MISVEEARNIILNKVHEADSETIDIFSSLNRVLAEDIYSTENIPPFTNSAMDGYAVVSSNLAGTSKVRPAVLKVLGKVGAGHMPETAIQVDSAVKIMTGAPVPEGADAVVPVEYTEVEGSVVKIFKEADRWENIRFAGEDIQKGQLVISKGKVLRPAEIGMLAALNINAVAVTKLPTVSILTTGDELIDIGEELLPGKIRNVNSYSLHALALRHGCNPLNLGVARDTKNDLREKLLLGIKGDMLIISGGVSSGDYDYVRTVLEDIGLKEIFWKVSVKPGKPVLFGMIRSTLVFGLPGNPVSSMVAFEQFVLPAIYKMKGIQKKPWNELNAVFEGHIKKPVGITNFVRGRTFLKNGRIHVKQTGPQSSGMFSSMVLANCLIVIPEDVVEVKDGDEVTIQIYDEIGE